MLGELLHVIGPVNVICSTSISCAVIDVKLDSIPISMVPFNRVMLDAVIS